MIGICMGDANGVGPEILLNTFREGLLPPDSYIIGDYSVLRECNDLLNFRLRLHRITDSPGFHKDALNIWDSGLLKTQDIVPGKLDRKVGAAALCYVREAAERALRGDLEAIVTLPVNKEAIRLSEPGFSGHTGYLAKLSDTADYTMMLVSDQLIVTHVSTHVSLREALDRVKKERIIEVIRMTDSAVRKLRGSCRIAVAGLNPHAGEGGAFGNEEIEEIEPAVSAARSEGFDVTGPVAPDTLFHRAVKGNFEAVVCMYHDQGHIPLKVLDFDGGVNVTLGLPFTRTSVDHGTAYDIAWQGKASLTSFQKACSMALKLTEKSLQEKE